MKAEIEFIVINNMQSIIDSSKSNIKGLETVVAKSSLDSITVTENLTKAQETITM
jgi:hypothetical protein